jgi:hypothetical protein
MAAEKTVPKLYVEGKDDISVISNLLLRHGVDTKRGLQHLNIKDKGNVDSVLEMIPEAIRANTDRPAGFVIDIDIAVADRWSAVKSKLREVPLDPPHDCPATGYVGQLAEYPHQFGIFLMPDCATDESKLEHLVESLVPENDPLWAHALESVVQAIAIVDEANKGITEEAKRCKRFRDVDRIKAEVHTWLAWQRSPGAPLGAAINEHILEHDSPEALNFLRWLRDLYGFAALAHL